jgi:hypothetical protein
MLNFSLTHPRVKESSMQSNQIFGKAADIICDLRNLDGASIEWWTITFSHPTMTLLACCEDGQIWEIHLIGPNYIDLPQKMTDVRFQLATSEILNTLKDKLPPRITQDEDFNPERMAVISCLEGTFLVWTHNVQLRRVQQTDYTEMNKLNSEFDKDYHRFLTEQ